MNCITVDTILIPPDNYSYVLKCNNCAIVIDACDEKLISEHLQRENLRLLAILSTHHHSDHTAGNLKLKETTGCEIIATDKRVKGADRIIADHDRIGFCNIPIEALLVPGHTKSQAAWYVREEKMLFTGDTLFGAGCGRIFEGGPDQLYNSLQKLASLPDTTQIYFGHEYTVDNLEFALTVEPDNYAVSERLRNEKEKLNSGHYTTPSSIKLEKSTNPFLRCKEKSIRKKLEMVDRSPVAVFAEIRKRKDRF
ncbi:Hydroxyacylglutathione hydrolase [Chitinispirillum alkaliphilum]|nr:Hydroxyacylglutathione hydrolase [Chitinispirillum alkaliphilum]